MIASSPKAKTAHLLIIIALVGLCFSRVLLSDFVNWDDDIFLTRNPLVRDLSWHGVKEIFATTVQTEYVPLTILSYAVEYAFFKYFPLIYHLDNLLLHIASTLLVYFLGLNLGIPRRGALVAVLLFGIHPLRVESVAWVTERKDVLMVFFCMAALQAYASYVRSSGPSRFVLSCVFAILAMLAKPVAVSLPFVFLLVDWMMARKMNVAAWMEKLWVLLPLLTIAQVTYIGHPRVLDEGLASHFQNMGEKALLMAWGFFQYISHFLWPQKLFLFYETPRPVAWSNPAYLLPVLALALAVWTLFKFRRRRLYVFAWGFYAISISLVLLFPDKYDLHFIGNRHMYFPCVGFCLFLGEVFARSGRSLRTGFMVVLAVLSVRTFGQTRVWESGASLWESQIRNNPGVATAVLYYKLGGALLIEKERAGTVEDFDRIEALYHEAMRIRPDYQFIYFDLGNLSLARGGSGNEKKAEEYYLKGLQSDPGNPQYRYYMAILYYKLGKETKAIEAFDDALKVESGDFRLRENIAQFCKGVDPAKQFLRLESYCDGMKGTEKK